MYTTNKKEQMKSVKKKIKTTKSNLTVLKKIKISIIKVKRKFNKTTREQQKGSIFVVEFKKKTDLYYNRYDFEHLYIDVRIKQLTSLLGHLKFRVDRLQKQLSSLEKNVKSVCFGSKKLAKA